MRWVGFPSGQPLCVLTTFLHGKLDIYQDLNTNVEEIKKSIKVNQQAYIMLFLLGGDSQSKSAGPQNCVNV